MSNDDKVLWYTRCPVPTPLGIAAQLGWLDSAFRAEGFAIRSIGDDPDPKVRVSHFDHSLSWSFRQGGSVPPIWARARGRDTRLVGITWTDEFQAIITLPGSGLTTLTDLAGRRFGVSRREGGIVDFHRATALKGLWSALHLHGLTTDEVQIVELPTADSPLIQAGDPSLFGLRRRLPYAAEIAALLRGEVEAVFVKGTQGITVANLFSAVTLAEFGFHPDPKIRINTGSPRILTVDSVLADERPDLVARLIGTIAEAGRWAEANPEDARRYVAREAGASEEQVLAANGPDLHRHLGIGLEPELVDAVAHLKRFLFEWGFIERDVDVAAWADPRPWSLRDKAA